MYMFYIITSSCAPPNAVPVIVHVFGPDNGQCYITAEGRPNENMNVFVHESTQELRFGREAMRPAVFDIERVGDRIQLKIEDGYVIPKENGDSVLVLGDSPPTPAFLSLEEI